jgi:hypothetical protein
MQDDAADTVERLARPKRKRPTKNVNDGPKSDARERRGNTRRKSA